jgi:hypothetical protein
VQDWGAFWSSTAYAVCSHSTNPSLVTL